MQIEFGETNSRRKQMSFMDGTEKEEQSGSERQIQMVRSGKCKSVTTRI